MSNKHEERFSLGRWSRRKLGAASTAPAPGEAAPATSVPPAPVTPAAAAPVELPPVDSLTFDSDFTAFLRPEVDDEVKRAALKQLFRDPRFNVMDGLDTYIDDYTKADPIPEDMLAGLMQRFVNASLPDEPPLAAVDAGKPSADAVEPPVRDAIAGDDAPAERSAAEPEVPSLATDADAQAEQPAPEPAPPAARDERR